MSINLYSTTIVPMKTMLGNMAVWLEKAEQHANAKSIPHTDFAEARLAPDMLPLPNQIYIACDTAKFLAVRVAGHENQAFSDDQKTFAELRERIAGTIKYLDSVKQEEFDAPDILIKEIPVYKHKFAGGLNYSNKYALPNFFFHVTTAYDILRHKGVELGKFDYLGIS